MSTRDLYAEEPEESRDGPVPAFDADDYDLFFDHEPATPVVRSPRERRRDACRAHLIGVALRLAGQGALFEAVRDAASPEAWERVHASFQSASVEDTDTAGRAAFVAALLAADSVQPAVAACAHADGLTVGAWLAFHGVAS